jgi:hypothetical protein
MLKKGAELASFLLSLFTWDASEAICLWEIFPFFKVIPQETVTDITNPSTYEMHRLTCYDVF